MSRIPSREEMIFADALAQPPAERDAFLAKACGSDARLLAQIAGLIAAHDGPAELFDAALAIRRATPEEKTGDWIGRYRLLQKIGEGGCGAVWMAEQQEPVRRRVALKIIKLGMDTQQVIARFEAERQALAMMDHPNIAKVLDGGASDSGRPYFVMELVRGVPITAFCDEQNLPTLDRLELFIKVCHAIQHAHQKGIIHRDIKPSNVLVTLHDDEAVPMVIDFGIAKATQGRLTDQTLYTAFDQFLGTPVYMSPEQAEFNALDVDTRSDIYSLGVLLYELLTGRPPFDPKTLREAGIEQIRRIIRETEPPRPSTRIRTLADAERTTVAKRRSTGPAQLLTMLRGDLDWIVLKALEKNRTRRYPTATALADDISRYLRHELVIARPPSLAYRLRKFIRRNRLVFAASMVVVITLTVSTVVSGTQAFRAREAERAASLDRRKVLDEQARAEKVIAYMIGGLRTQLAKLGRLDVIEGAANESMAYFTSLNPNDVNDATLTRHALALLGIGQLRMDQAEYKKAEAAYREAYARATTLAVRNPNDFEIVFVLSRAAYANGFVHWRRGEFNEAKVWFLRQQDTAKRLMAIKPDDSRGQRQLTIAQHNLAGIDVEHGELQRAKETFLAELALLKRLSTAAPEEIDLKQQIASVIGFLGMIAERSGELPEAGRWYAEHASQLETCMQLHPDDVQDRSKLADTLFSHRAEIFAITGEYARAQETLAQAREILEKLVAYEPANHWWRLGLFTVQLRETIVATAAGPRERAEQLVDATRKAFQQLTAKEPSDRRWTVRIALAWRFEAEWRHAAGAPDAAAAAARAIEMGEKAIRPDRGVSLPETAECAQARIVAGRIASAHGDTAAARSHWRRADELLAPLIAGSRNWRVLDPAARVAAFLGRHAEAGQIIAELNQLGYVPLQPWPDLPLSL